MREPDGTLIRFAGVLREDHRFIHIPAWETSAVFERPDEGDGSYVVDLTDPNERVVSRASPTIEFRDTEDPYATGMRLADVLVYVPVHREARLLIFRRLQPAPLEIFRAELSEQPPAIGDVVVERARRGTVQVHWTVKHDRPVTSTVFYVRERQPALVLATGLVESALEVDGRTLPAGKGRIAITATDGFRAGTAVGPAVEGLSEPRLEITAPEPDGILPPDQPATLSARATDSGGADLAPEDISWEVDGAPAAAGRLSMTAPLEPGVHDIVVHAVVGGTALKAGVQLTVAPRNEDQDRFAKVMADLPPLAERMRDGEDL